MAENVLLSELTDSCGVLLPVLEPLVGLLLVFVLPLLLQAAITSAALAASAASPALRVTEYNEFHLAHAGEHV